MKRRICYILFCTIRLMAYSRCEANSTAAMGLTERCLSELINGSITNIMERNGLSKAESFSVSCDLASAIQNCKDVSKESAFCHESSKVWANLTFSCSEQYKLHNSIRAKTEALPQLDIPYALINPASTYENRKWVVWMSSFTKYRGEQYNGQRRSLLELMFLMRKYAPERGLVEPVFVFNTHNSSLYEHLHLENPELLKRLSTADAEEEFIWLNMTFRTTFGIFASPAGALLDMTTLSMFTKYPVLPFDAFKWLSNSTVNQLLIAAPELTGRASSLDCDSHVLNVSANFFGSDWNIQSFHCLTDEEPTINSDFASVVLDNDVKNLGAVYARRRLVEDGHQYDDIEMQFFRMRAFLRWSTSVVIHALSFIQTELFSQPFLGVHWRRGDRLVYVARYKDWTLSVDKRYLVIQALHACRQYNLSYVYLMTNCGSPEDIRYIISELNKKSLIVKMSNSFSRWQDEDKHLAVESAIMSFAEFVLISSSTVSGTILEERILLGFSPYSFNNLAAVSGYAEEYFRLPEQIERELAAYPDLLKAMQSADGLGRRCVICLRDSSPAICAAQVIASSRSIAEKL